MQKAWRRRLLQASGDTLVIAKPDGHAMFVVDLQRDNVCNYSHRSHDHVLQICSPAGAESLLRFLHREHMAFVMAYVTVLHEHPGGILDEL